MQTASGKTNPRLTNLIILLKESARSNEAHIWREIALRLEAPSKNYAEVNIGKINRYAMKGETILVPGKVLGTGILTQPVQIAALNFSKSAVGKIEKAKGACMTIEELLSENPKGNRIRILR
ncbi:MAG: 50S ribosomal protein L18e [Methanomicrobiales archaeon]|nr:50S ribosomal protein L18e [Methanomicrobiales archaeon]